MTLPQQEQLFFKKHIKLIQEYPQAIRSDVEGLLAATFNFRIDIYRCFSSRPDDLLDQIDQIKQAALQRIEEFKTVERELREVLVLSLEFYCFELANSTESTISEERRLVAKLDNWCGLTRIRRNKAVWKEVQGNLLLFAGCIEL